MSLHLVSPCSCSLSEHSLRKENLTVFALRTTYNTFDEVKSYPESVAFGLAREHDSVHNLALSEHNSLLRG